MDRQVASHDLVHSFCEASSREEFYRILEKSDESAFQKRTAAFYSLSLMLKSEGPLAPIGMTRVGMVLHVIASNSQVGGYSREELSLLLEAMEWARVTATVEDAFLILKSETGVGRHLKNSSIH